MQKNTALKFTWAPYLLTRPLAIVSVVVHDVNENQGRPAERCPTVRFLVPLPATMTSNPNNSLMPSTSSRICNAGQGCNSGQYTVSTVFFFTTRNNHEAAALTLLVNGGCHTAHLYLYYIGYPTPSMIWITPFSRQFC